MFMLNVDETPAIPALSSSLRNLLGFRQGTQLQHRNHSEQRPWGEQDERVTPTGDLFKARDQLDRNCRQQKSETGLNRQCGADVLRIAELSDAGRELS